MTGSRWVWLFACWIGWVGLSVAEGPSIAAGVGVTEQLRRDIEFLASDELRGRSVADDTIDVAANYVAKRMTQLGLDTTVMEGGPFQPVSIALEPKLGPSEDNFVEFQIGGQEPPLRASLGEVMMPMAIGTSSAELTGPVSFVGYGIDAPDLDYQEYANLDVQGHVVIILRKEPQLSDPNSRFDGTKNSRYAPFVKKIETAVQRGASAVIFVNDSASAQQSVSQIESRIRGERTRRDELAELLEQLPQDAVNNRKTIGGKIAAIDDIVDSMTTELASSRQGLMKLNEAGSRRGNEPTVPVLSITRSLLDQLLSQTGGKSLQEIEQGIDADLNPRSSALGGVTARLKIEITPTTRVSDNVIGVLHGKGELVGESIVIGAHYDHVGMGGIGSLAPGTIAVHNGADDNGSGTSVMMAVAGQLVERLASFPSHRQITFIAFTGEERGLLGSKHYVRYPRYPLESTVAMVNLDMVGRLRDNELTVYGTGTADSIEPIVEAANQRTQFDLYKISSGFGPSDHQTFYEAGIPVLFFFTGLHSDYHRPSDDSDKIDFGGMTRITDIVSESTFQLAVRRERPRYVETDRKFQMRYQQMAYLGVQISNRGDHVRISGVVPNGPAERAGIQVGDRMVTLGEKQIVNYDDVQDALRGKNPGNEIKIELIREGQTLTLSATLGKRP